MDQSEKRNYLISYLINEQPQYQKMRVPGNETEQKGLLRALMNVRMPGSISEDFLKVQDEYLQERSAEKGIINIEDLTPLRGYSLGKNASA